MTQSLDADVNVFYKRIDQPRPEDLQRYYPKQYGFNLEWEGHSGLELERGYDANRTRATPI